MQTSVWQHWVNFILGLWIILSGYMNFGPQANTTNLTIAGIIIAGIALWGGLSNRSVDRYHERRPSHA